MFAPICGRAGQAGGLPRGLVMPTSESASCRTRCTLCVLASMRAAGCAQDMMYIDTKLRDLFQLTEDAYKRLETQSFQMQRNITELEQVDESTLTDVRA